MKNHPDITENILTGTLRINQANKHVFSSKISKNVQSVICLQTEVFDKLLLYFFYRTQAVGLMRKVYVYFSPTCA